MYAEKDALCCGPSTDGARQVDMVLLAGDLFHDNKPSRKSMYQVMRSLRKNCLGMKPCELEFLGDAQEIFEGAFGHVNYEDPDINISIPVFSIHGNHDDPSGEGHFCSLDLLQVSGLVNYFGRVPEADNIKVKPVLLQKGGTKLALFGMSNIRDERMFRTFRDHKVSFFRPGQQTTDFFNIMAVHQNHHAHTATSYLPEDFLPDWLDLVVWGHEHECLIDPQQNPITGFHVMQPGSSVATSLVPGEAVQKHVAILSVTGRQFTCEKIPLKTVRPFRTQEIVLATDKRFKDLAKKKDHRIELSKKLAAVVDEMIEEANQEWADLQDDPDNIDEEDRPLPLIRLKVEYSSPDGQFDVENPQRFSNKFVGKVANTHDVVYFYRKKKSSAVGRNAKQSAIAAILEHDNPELDSIKVEALVQEYLTAQSLKVLPQGEFGDAVNQYVEKDDPRAMEKFINKSLANQLRDIVALNADEEELSDLMQQWKDKQDQLFQEKQQKTKKRKSRARPEEWDSDMDGHWGNSAEASLPEGSNTASKVQVARSQARSTAARHDDYDVMMEEDSFEDEAARAAPTTRATKATRIAAAKKAPAKKTPAKPAAKSTRGRKKGPFEDDSEDQMDVDEDMFIDDDEEEEDAPPPPPPKRTAPTTARTNRITRAQPAKAAPKTKQTVLNFSQTQRPTRAAAARGATQNTALEISDDEISEEDAFESMAPAKTRRR